MQKLQVTTPEEADGHKHIAYINTDSGVGAIAPGGKDRHQHELIYDPPREPREPTPAVPPQIDPMTGMPMINPETGMPDEGTPEDPGDPGKEVGTWIVGPAPDGHTHEELEDYAPKPKKKEKVNDDEIIKDCLSLWREGLALEQDCIDKGRESERFRKGDQWDDETKRLLEALNRAPLTINEIGPQIDTLIGYQMEQRTDFRYLPQEGGDQRAADMMNIVVKRITDECYYGREETKAFTDTVVTGKGILHVYMSYERSIQGDIKLEKYPWDAIHYGPHEKEDLSDCEFEHRDRMQSIATLKRKYPKKAKEIEACYDLYCGKYPEDIKDDGVNGTHTDYRMAKKIDDLPYTVNGQKPLVDVQRKQFRECQCTKAVYVDRTVIFNEEENFFFPAEDWEEEDIAAANELPGFLSITQTKKRFRITRYCGNVVLSDENPAEYPLDSFMTTPIYAYRQNGEYWGKVEAAKDPQREINKRRSQIMDQLNRTGSSVQFIDQETFIDDREAERYKRDRSKPASVFKVQTTSNVPVTEQGGELSPALVNIMQMDQQDLQRLMNIVANQEGANESGIMLMEKKKSRLVGNQFIFDNLSFAKQKLGKDIVGLVQRYYTPERIERLLNSQYSRAKFQIDGQDYSEFSKDEIIEILSNTDLTELDVVVTESSFAPSTRLGIAQMLLEAIQKGSQIPLDLPIEFMDIPSDVKARISERLQQQSEAETQAQADTNNSEITKTLIAKGQYTVSPEKASELGLIPAGQNPPLPSEPVPTQDEENIQATEYATNLASSLAG